MSKRTKIVATAGPASRRPEVLEAMVAEGADVLRLNFSHGSPADHRRAAEHVHRIADETGRNLALLQDLQGPKLRVGQFPGGSVELEAGRRFILDLAENAADSDGSSERASLTYSGLASDIEVGQLLLLDDGNLRLRATKISPEEIETEVEVGGTLGSSKGVNVPGAHLSVEALTEKDVRDLAFGLEIGVDWVAKSFVRRREDVESTRRELERLGSKARLMAKIETPAAVERFDEILEAADGVMVARGDLGVEMAPEEVPVVQKRLIGAAHDAGKPVITATQMLESMIHNARPTRAETSDVANAIFDGTDAVMLSAETAIGDYPAEAVTMMRKVAQNVEASEAFESRRRQLRPEPAPTTPGAIARAACVVAETLAANAIVVFTASGNSAWRIARNRPGVPVLALTPAPEVRAALALAFGVRAELAPAASSANEMVALAIEHVQTHELAVSGDCIVITAGVPFGVEGTTNLLWVNSVE